MTENNLPDVQETEPTIKIPIYEVGVENVEVPFMIESKYGGFHHMTANVSMRTDLDKNVRGISMSRLLLTLKPYLDIPLKSKLIKEILSVLVNNVGGTSAFMKFEFKLPIIKKSIKTNNAFPLYYKCRFEGQLYKVKSRPELHPDWHNTMYFRFFQGVEIQYASYCPCSAELSSCLPTKGFPHNQRSFANILVETDTEQYVWLEDIIENIESQIQTLPYPIIKRLDEQEIARVASENPMFVEDAIRIISKSLDEMPGIIDWIVKCVHQESIHTSEAIAINYKCIEGGMDSKLFI